MADQCSNCDRPATTYGPMSGAPYCDVCGAWIFSGGPHPDDVKDDDNDD